MKNVIGSNFFLCKEDECVRRFLEVNSMKRGFFIFFFEIILLSEQNALKI